MLITKISSFFEAGPKKKISQDYIMPSRFMKTGVYSDLDAKCENIFIVADGVSSNPEAASISKYTASRVYEELKKNSHNIDFDELKEVIVKVNNEVLENFVGVEKYGGTTLTGIILLDALCYIFHIGDSVIFFHYENGEMINMTPIQHTNLYEHFLHEENISYAQVKHNSYKVLTHYIGQSKVNLDFYLSKHTLQGVQKIVLMSDGVYSLISDTELKYIFNTSKKPLEDIIELTKEPREEIENFFIKINKSLSLSNVLIKNQLIENLTADDKSLVLIDLKKTKTLMRWCEWIKKRSRK